MEVRVLQVVTVMDRGGIETMLMNYYRHIDREEVQFDFLTHRESDGAYGEEILALGGHIYHLPRLNPFSQGYRRALGDFFLAHPEYRVVHVHQDCMSAIALEAARKAGVPVRIAHSHNNGQRKDLKYPIKLWYRRRIPRYASHLMACSTEAGHWMFGKHSFELLQNAIDLKAFSFDPERRRAVRVGLGLSENDLVFGHVGRFMHQKNHRFLIDIFEEIRKKETRAKLLLVGDGEEMEAIQKKAAEKKLQEDILFVGVRADVADLLQAMDVFVFPSLYEGLPVVLVEAQAAGLPCLISDRVPEEIMITDLVCRIPLEKGEKKWAEEATALARRQRTCETGPVETAGYSIEQRAKELERRYLALANGST